MDSDERRPDEIAANTKLEQATLAFAQSLAAAILAGTERDFDVTEPGIAVPSERPMPMAPPMTLPPDGPAKPRRGEYLWRRLAYMERKAAMAEFNAARLKPVRARPAFDCLAVTDLTDDTCKYPHDGATILFCGRQPNRGSYCADHARVCFARGE